MKYVWLALFALFVGIASFLAEEIFFPIRPPFPSNTPEAILYQDLKILKTQKSLPSEFSQIHRVYFSDHRLHKMDIKWLDLSKHFFSQNPEGKFDLQIEAFDAPADEKQKVPEIAIFQFSLFERTTQNKVWELSRSYSFSSPSSKQ